MDIGDSPKGMQMSGETEEQTAIREVKEETNLDVEIIDNKRYTMQYITDRGNLKEVVLFMAKQLNSNIKAQEEEITAIKWLNFEEAVKTITYDNAKELLKNVLKDKNVAI